MNLIDLGIYSWSNLMRHKIRTGLTLCGVAVGVGTLTFLVSLGLGAGRQATQSLEQHEAVTRVMVMAKGLKDKVFGRGRASETDTFTRLQDADIERLRRIPGVKSAYPRLASAVTVEGAEGALRPFLVIEGMPAEAVTEGMLHALLAGKYWTAAEDGAAVCALPSDMLRELGFAEAKEAINRTIAFAPLQDFRRYREVREEAGRRRYERPSGVEVIEVTVVGVFDSEQLGTAGRSIVIPLALARRVSAELGNELEGAGEGEGYEFALVKIGDVAKAKLVIDDIEAAGYDTFSVFDLLGFLKIVFAFLTVMLGMLGSVGLFVAFFGIANTMVMAVLERTREIGVIKALGGRERDIRRLVFLEAALIGGLGGLIGVALAWVSGMIGNAVIGAVARTELEGTAVSLFHLPVLLALLAVGVSTFVAAVAGIYPAWRAARLDPVVSLRSE